MYLCIIICPLNYLCLWLDLIDVRLPTHGFHKNIKRRDGVTLVRHATKDVFLNNYCRILTNYVFHSRKNNGKNRRIENIQGQLIQTIIPL